MIKKFGQRWIECPAHFFLIPIFFILAANNQRNNEVNLSEVLLVIGALELPLLVYYLFIRKAQQFQKLATLASYVLFYFLFFTNLRTLANLLFASRQYVMFIALTLLAALIFFILLKRRGSFIRLTIFLNLFILGCIANELFTAITIHRHPPPAFAIQPNDIPDTTSAVHADHKKPNVYLILFDAYPSAGNLKKYFGYNNDLLLAFLESESFYVLKNSRSNYKSTIQTISSMFNGGYLPESNYYTSTSNSAYTYLKEDEKIRDNRIAKVLRKNGYAFRNLSIFNMKDAPSPVRTDLHYFALNAHDYFYFLYAKTLLGYLHSVTWKYFEYTRERKAIELMKKEIGKSGPPKFVYFHSMIVHEPYYFNANGDLLWDNWFYIPTTNAYKQQVEFANSVIRDLIQRIKKFDENSIIILMSDHGFRNLKNVSQQEISEESYSNLSAVFFPDGDYTLMDDNITPVNLMRLTLNEALGLRLARLPDKTGLK